MPLDTNSIPIARPGQRPIPTALANNWRVIAGLAVLAGVWTLAQLAWAMRPNGVQELLPTALVIYAGGIGYLTLVAFIALRFDQAIRAGRLQKYSAPLWLAHLIVVVAAIAVAWRGVTARGVLVGLGASLVAWGVVAILALLAEIMTRLVGRQLSAATANSEVAKSGPAFGSLTTACLGCVAVLVLGLAYLESRPLPNLPDKPHVSPGQEAGASGAEKQSATHDEPTARGDS